MADANGTTLGRLLESVDNLKQKIEDAHVEQAKRFDQLLEIRRDMIELRAQVLGFTVTIADVAASVKQLSERLNSVERQPGNAAVRVITYVLTVLFAGGLSYLAWYFKAGN